MVVIKGIIVIGLLILIHELGHFIAARIFGVRVLQFAIGFGPKLVCKTIGETQYVIRALPIGGYVQMLGENEEGGETDPDSFDSKSIFARFVITAAGPAINILFAVMILPVAYFVGVSVPAYQEDVVRVGYVHSDSEARRVGLLPGALLTSINGQDITKWNEANRFISKLDGRSSVEVVGSLRGVVFSEMMNFSPLAGLRGMGIEPTNPVVVESIIQGTSADVSDLKIGDLILAVEEEPVLSFLQCQERLQECAGRGCSVNVLRHNETLAVTINPVLSSGIIDVGFNPKNQVVVKKYSALQAVDIAVIRLKELTVISGSLLARLFDGAVSGSEVGGPITAIKSAGVMTGYGIGTSLSMIAFFSLQIGFFNLLPVPALDGGTLAMLSVEAVFRRPLPKKFTVAFQLVGLALMLVLMLCSVFFDLFFK
ncbi:MAG: RIP metalloprotease RseP [Deltaproteobacteria bacterium]|nr:RIP metalloprotease RseP [Deltaproteobacteria bacterium]